MDVRPVVLEGDRLRLEPLQEGHADDLWRHAKEEVFQYMQAWWETGTLDHFREHIAGVISRTGCVSFAMVVRESGEAVGSSSYLDIRPEHRALEVGATWIGKDFQGGWVNPEAKLLMLGHAFDDLQCIRVQLKTDGRNLQSQRAMEKMGATREGVLRHHMICKDGFLRSSPMYSVLREEWPRVKAGLQSRLQVLRSSA